MAEAGKYARARSNVKYLGSLVRGLVELDEIMGETWDLAKEVDRLRAACDGLVEAQSRLTTRRDEIRADNATLEAQAAEFTARARVDAETTVAHAIELEKNAEIALEDAHREARGILVAAQGDATAMIVGVEKELAGKRQEIAAASASLASIADAATVAEKRLAAANEALEAIRRGI